MLVLRVIGLLMIIYGILCIWARNFLFKWTIPRRRKLKLTRPKWDRVTVLTGLLSLGLGIFLILAFSLV